MQAVVYKTYDGVFDAGGYVELGHKPGNVVITVAPSNKGGVV